MGVYGTIYYDGHAEVAEHALQHDIRIRLTDVPYRLNIEGSTLELHLPLRIWATVRRHGPHSEQYLDMPDTELEAEARASIERWIDDTGSGGYRRERPEARIRDYIRHRREIRDRELSVSESNWE